MRRGGGHTFTMNPIARAGMAGLGDDYGNTPEDLVGYELANTTPFSFPSGNVTNNPGLPASSGSSLDFNQLIQMGKDLGIAFMAYDQQKMVQQINLERINRGMAPINPSLLAPTMNFGLSSDTMTYLLIGGGALVLLLMMGKKH